MSSREAWFPLVGAPSVVGLITYFDNLVRSFRVTNGLADAIDANYSARRPMSFSKSPVLETRVHSTQSTPVLELMSFHPKDHEF